MNYLEQHLTELKGKFLAKGDQEGADICEDFIVEVLDRPENHDHMDDVEMIQSFAIFHTAPRRLKAVEALKAFVVFYHSEPEHA